MVLAAVFFTKNPRGWMLSRDFDLYWSDKMDSARILIAIKNDTLAGNLRSILAGSGYTVVEHARDGNDCIRKIRALKPDISIMEYGLPALNGFEIAKLSIEDGLSDVILITTQELLPETGNLSHETGFICLVKPLNKIALINTIDLMLKNRKRIRQLEKEIEQLKLSLDTRKEVEKAKGLLMKYLNLSEAEAFKRIQKQSMDRGIAMKEIAKAIILAYDI